jgi:DNA primase
MIKKEIIELIREKTDIVQVINEYIPLKRCGRNYRSLCPFHSEKSPSFYVSPEKQIYHCFGCGASGSVISFLMDYEKISFPEALRKLASKIGLSLETENVSHKNQALYDACEFVASFYSENLKKAPHAKNYLQQRKINDEVIERFRIGYAPSGNSLYRYAMKRNFSLEALIEAGLIVKKEDGYSDWFYDRIIFPIHSISGKIIGFNGRAIGDNVEPKYINTQESPIFKKREILYGLYQAKNYLQNSIPILVEGNFDVLSLVQNGFNTALAPLGTALTPTQVQIIQRYTNKSYIAFDGDNAGINAAFRALEILLGSNVEPLIVIMPNGFDPDRYIRTYGAKEFQALLDTCKDFVDFIIHVKCFNSDLNQVFLKKTCLDELLRFISVIEDNVLQELYLHKVSAIFNISKENLSAKISRITQGAKIPEDAWKLKALSNLERQILKAMLINQDYIQIAAQEFSADLFDNIELQEIFKILCQEKNTLPELLDSIEKAELKKIIAELAIVDQNVPSLDDFRYKLYTYKSEKLYLQIQRAKADGNNELVQRLLSMYYSTKKKQLNLKEKNHD